VPDRFESTCFARYAIVQYKAKAEYYLLYARYILEVQAEIPEDKLRQLLLAASIRSFHNVAGENNTRYMILATESSALKV